MNSGIYLAAKACLLIGILGFSSSVFGASCPPDDPKQNKFKFGACTSAVGAAASFPGNPNFDNAFGCADRVIKIPLCCTKPTNKGTPRNKLPNTKKDCTTNVSQRKVRGSGPKRNKPGNQ